MGGQSKQVYDNDSNREISLTKQYYSLLGEIPQATWTNISYNKPLFYSYRYDGHVHYTSSDEQTWRVYGGGTRVDTPNINDIPYETYYYAEQQWWYSNGFGTWTPLATAHEEQHLARKVCIGCGIYYRELLVPMYAPVELMLRMMVSDNEMIEMIRDVDRYFAMCQVQRVWRGHRVRKTFSIPRCFTQSILSASSPSA